MGNVVMSLNDRELTLLSDGILAMIGKQDRQKALCVIQNHRTLLTPT